MNSLSLSLSHAEICLAQPLIWNCSTSSDNIFPNIPIDNSFIADSIRDSPYLSSAYIYRFQPDINDSCNGKTLVEFCFDNTESVTNIVMDILLGKIDRINSANTFISAIVLARININAIVTCNRELTDNNAVCCHSEQINISLPTQMNGFAVVFPNQALLEYNDSQYQVETFVTTAIDFIRINSNDQPILEVTGYTTNLTLRFLRFVIEKNETTTKALPDVNPIMINIIAATVSPIVIVLTIILVTLTIVVLVIMQRKRGKKAVTEREGFDNANAC